jgi:hypothetical protein
MTKLEILEMLLELIYSTDIRNVGTELYEFYVMDRDDLISEIERKILKEKR